MTFTVTELADELSTTPAASRGLLAFLRETGVAEFKGERPATSGRKGEQVFEIPRPAMLLLHDLARHGKKGQK